MSSPEVVEEFWPGWLDSLGFEIGVGPFWSFADFTVVGTDESHVYRGAFPLWNSDLEISDATLTFRVHFSGDFHRNEFGATGLLVGGLRRGQVVRGVGLVEECLVSGEFGRLSGAGVEDLVGLVAGWGGVMTAPQRRWNHLDVVLRSESDWQVGVVMPLWRTDGTPGDRGVRLGLSTADDGTLLVDVEAVVDVDPQSFDLVEPLPVGEISGPLPPELAEDPLPEPWRPGVLAVIERVLARDFQGLIDDGTVRTVYPESTVIPGLAWSFEAYAVNPSPVVSPPGEWWRYCEVFGDGPGTGWNAVDVPMWESNGGSELTMHFEIYDLGDHPEIYLNLIEVM
ncbi:MAG: hypothetical protein WBA45_03310 [Microthrixaceae bacterium]